MASSNIVQSVFLSLSYIIYRTLRSHRWATIHRKQLYQRSPPAPYPVIHALPSSPPPQALPLLSYRHCTRHPQASATAITMILGKITRIPVLRSHRENNRVMILMLNRNSKHYRSRGNSNPSETTQRRRRQYLSGFRRRRRRRSVHRQLCPALVDRHCRNINRRIPSIAVAAASPLLLLLLPRRRRLSQQAWLPRRSMNPTNHPAAPPRKVTS